MRASKKNRPTGGSSMKVKVFNPISAAGLILLTGLIASPTLASEMAKPLPTILKAQPNSSQTRERAARVGLDLVEAERTSFYSPNAEKEFSDALSAIRDGHDDKAIAALDLVEAELRTKSRFDPRP